MNYFLVISPLGLSNLPTVKINSAKFAVFGPVNPKKFKRKFLAANISALKVVYKLDSTLNNLLTYILVPVVKLTHALVS